MAANIRSYVDEAIREVRKNDGQLLKIPMEIDVLLAMALAFLTSNRKASFRLRSKILELLRVMDPDAFHENDELLWRYHLALDIGQAVMEKHANTVTKVELRVMENMEWEDRYREFFHAYHGGVGFFVNGRHMENELSDEEIGYLDGFVSTRLRYSYLWRIGPWMREVSDRIEADDLGCAITEFNDKVMNGLERLLQAGRRARSANQFESQDFITGTESFAAAIRTTIEARRRPSSLIKTGVRMLNEMLGGGYEGSRVYIHFGRSGDWKSGILCSAAFWACDPKFNPEIRTSDPTKKPAVLFLTMENDMYETIERMVSFALGQHVDLKDLDIEPDDIVRALEDAFSSETCRFVFSYRPSRTINTSHIDDMIGDLATQGYEVVMVVQDYIKRIKASDANAAKTDSRHLELGAIVDEFSNTAKKFNVPFVTGMQLNRDAYAKFEAAIKSGKTDAVKELSATNVGESINVFENADCVIFQGRISSQALGGQLFLTLRRAKLRGRSRGGPDYFAQPFAIDPETNEVNEMKLVEDAYEGCPTRGLLDIGTGIQENYDPTTQSRRSEEVPQPTRRAPRGNGPVKRQVPAVGGRATVTTVSSAAEGGGPEASAQDLENLGF